MTTTDILATAKHVRAELEALRIDIGLDKPRRSLLAHTLAAQQRLDEILLEMDLSEMRTN